MRLCARPARPLAGSRRSTVNVRAVFSLSGAVRSFVRSARGGGGKQQAPSPAPHAAAVAPPTVAPPQLQPRKAVQGVPLADRPTVERVMLLTSLAAHPSANTLATQLAEHELALVTTSATCDAMFGSALDSMCEEYEASGDGMASPLADIRAAAEQLAAEVRGDSPASDWNPAMGGPGGSSAFAPPPSSSHALEQLMAQADHDALSGPSKTSRDARSVMARVQALQGQIRAAAAAGSKKVGSVAAQAKAAAAPAGGAASAAAAKQQTKPAPARPAAPAPAALQRGAWRPPADDDADCCGDAAAMPVLPGLAGASPAAEAGRRLRAAAAAARAAAAPSYPTYHDPASSWLVVDSADGLRTVVLQAPPALEAAVAAGRAASELTTFESYSLGTKVNKALYEEANALYNRLLPLVLDHLDEAGPAARIMLCGSGLGGSLAALLLLMAVSRGMRPSAFAPVYTLNAPSVLAEVPDLRKWCSRDGCSLQDVDGMFEELLSRGVLSQLGLPQDAIRNVYHHAAAAAAAVRAVQSPRSPLAGLAASSSKQLSSMVGSMQLDVAALQASPLVPEALRKQLGAWLSADGPGLYPGSQRLHILNPVGRMLLYVHSSSAGSMAAAAH